MNTHWSLLLIIPLTVLLTSCAINIAKAPQEWPEAVNLENDTCIDLTGFYINQAIDAPSNVNRASHEKYWPVYLSKLLIPYIPSREFVEHKWADSIELSGIENGKLKIILKKSNKLIFKKILSEHADFTCSSQGLVMKDRSSPANMMGITERFEKTTFTKGVDGSILVNEQEVDVGTLMFIPYGEKTIQRYRFLPIGSLK